MSVTGPKEVQFEQNNKAQKSNKQLRSVSTL